jgi:NhaA family Na+:H+ antiporter
MKTRIPAIILEFFESEQASGVILIACTVFSLLIASSPAGKDYAAVWHADLGADIGPLHLKHSVEYWINDALMAIFFLLVGLEIERELYVGKLSNLRQASLPVLAALGGMAFPALIHFALNKGLPTQGGFGVPMATDIAFSLGVMALLGRRVPVTLKIFLTALAIIDDLGAILVIAIFYVQGFSLAYLLAALAVFAILLVLNRLNVMSLVPYILGGVVMWYCMLQSGVHATLAGVLLAFTIPFRGGGEGTPSSKLEHAINKPVAFLIMPLFALANTGISLAGDWMTGLITPNTLGIFAGLVIGKPLGIGLLSRIAVALGVSSLPEGVTWRHVLGAGMLGGIGFTMSIFITLLAFNDPGVVERSKIIILFSSLVTGLMGYAWLRFIAPAQKEGDAS